MSDNHSIINLGDLSKPATVLIEKISSAVGGLFRPYQIVRVAKAEAEAELIRAESEIQITDLHRRAFRRFLEEEARKQKNIEEITCQALPQLGDKARPEQVEDDWIANFFDKCRLVSDTQMQALWSRVLAGEANAPGSYSKRTVGFLSSLDKSDASMFTSLCTFGWNIGALMLPLVYEIENEIYRKHGIVFDMLIHLDSIGLVQFDSLSGFMLDGLGRKLRAYYYGKPTDLELLEDSDNKIKLGHVILTKVGQELAPICGSQPDWGFRDYVLSKWKAQGYIKGDAPQLSAPAD